MFLAISALPSFLGAIGHTTLPESPKFLMSCGRNHEALEVLQKVYQINTGNPRDQYPVSSFHKFFNMSTYIVTIIFLQKLLIKKNIGLGQPTIFLYTGFDILYCLFMRFFKLDTDIFIIHEKIKFSINSKTKCSKILSFFNVSFI